MKRILCFAVFAALVLGAPAFAAGSGSTKPWLLRGALFPPGR